MKDARTWIGIFTYLPFYDLVVNVSAVCKSFNQLLKGKEANVQLWMVVAEKLFLQFHSHIIESNFARFYDGQAVRFAIPWREVSRTVYRHLNGRSYHVTWENDAMNVYIFHLEEDDEGIYDTPDQVRRYAKKWIHVRRSTLFENVCIVRYSSDPSRLALYFENVYTLARRLFLGYEPRSWFIELVWTESIETCLCARCSVILQPTSLPASQRRTDSDVICATCIKKDYDV